MKLDYKYFSSKMWILWIPYYWQFFLLLLFMWMTNFRFSQNYFLGDLYGEFVKCLNESILLGVRVKNEPKNDIFEAK